MRAWLIGGAVVGLGGVGVAAALLARRRGLWGGPAQAALGTGGSGPGWSAGSDVQLTEPMAEFLTHLAETSGATLYVTSGVRTAADQARAMLKKLDLGNGFAELHDLYKRDDLVAELADIPQTLEAWTSLLQRQIDGGDLLSSHLSGMALDLRSSGGGAGSTGNLSTAEYKRVVAAAQALGARVVEEGVPPHIHLELRGALA